jgi:hypothetical protein
VSLARRQPLLLGLLARSDRKRTDRFAEARNRSRCRRDLLRRMLRIGRSDERCCFDLRSLRRTPWIRAVIAKWRNQKTQRTMSRTCPHPALTNQVTAANRCLGREPRITNKAARLLGPQTTRMHQVWSRDFARVRGGRTQRLAKAGRIMRLALNYRGEDRELHRDGPLPAGRSSGSRCGQE